MTEKEFLESLHKNTRNAAKHDDQPGLTGTNLAHVESLKDHRNTPPDARPHVVLSSKDVIIAAKPEQVVSKGPAVDLIAKPEVKSAPVQPTTAPVDAPAKAVPNAS